MSASRSDHLALGYSSHPAAQNRSGSPSMSVNASLIDSLASSNRQAFGIPAGISPASKMAGNSRSGTGSPSHDMASSSRLSFKRAREIQAQEGIPGLPLNMWSGPPTSGNSTPLRENIPESPTDDFPDFVQLPTPETIAQPRRTRAGTLPSRLGGVGNGLLTVKSARATPSPNPFNKSPSPNNLDPHHERLPQAASSAAAGPPSTLYSRLRAGSMPQRSPFASLSSSNSPFGPSIFSSWNPSGVGRERGSTLASIASVGSNAPSSPAQSQFSKEGAGDSDVHMRTLDYLGLAETPQPVRATLATPYIDMSSHASRFRSYSVNNQDKYADEYDDTPTLERLQEEIDATNQAIHNHNLAVQAFASQASRPRARTAGVLDTPGSRLMRTYVTGAAGVPGSVVPAEIRLHDEDEVVYEGLSQAVAGLNIGRTNSRNAGLLSADEQGLEGPTSALWLGGIPTSTTTSTLIEMFKSHGPIVSARVLTHKNCGFVNFERVESAISAKANMNGKEIFPGAGPIRINFAKPPSASETPGHDGAFPSPSPDPFGKAQDASRGGSATPSGDVTPAAVAALGNVTPTVPPLREMTADIVEIVGQFGATDDDRLRISQSLQSAIQYDSFAEEIPPVREPTHTRVHDAPKLRDIRKRIDNQMLSRGEIENVALDMLPEIAELSSDYLGNTVVQKLFDHCSDPLRDAMLREICPHLAEIGIHKNGTWAAQKIIDVCKTPTQLALIVEHLRPYTVPLFLDQYGNYVLQGCLKFGSPYNDFIFETMLSQMWEIAQGRFGARAMRACLESHHATKEQQRMLAAAIALHSVQLATNANGALLLTWFLDTCTFPQRRTVLSPRLVPHLVHLCTHKVAYLTVLKVINQKAEADARDTILKALFFSPNNQILEAILNDQACGATLIFKVLTTPFFDEAIRGQVVENVKSVLLRIKAQPGQGYKRLMDEVGLSTRTAGSSREASASASNAPSSANAGAGAGAEQRQRPGSRHTSSAVANGPQSQPNKPFYNNGTPAPVNPAGPFDPAANDQRMDNGNGAGHPPFPPYNQGMMYNPSAGPIPPAVNLQQLQYQQNVMGRGNPPMSYPYPAMQPGFGFGTQTPPMEPYRPQNGPNGNAMQPHPPPPPPQMPGGQPPHAPPGFGMGMGMGMGGGGGGGGYGYGGNVAGMPPNMGAYMQGPPPPQPQQQQQQQQQQQEQANGRRGRGRHGQPKDQRQGGQR